MRTSQFFILNDSIIVFNHIKPKKQCIFYGSYYHSTNKMCENKIVDIIYVLIFSILCTIKCNCVCYIHLGLMWVIHLKTTKLGFSKYVCVDECKIYQNFKIKLALFQGLWLLVILESINNNTFNGQIKTIKSTFISKIVQSLNLTRQQLEWTTHQ